MLVGDIQDSIRQVLTTCRSHLGAEGPRQAVVEAGARVVRRRVGDGWWVDMRRQDDIVQVRRYLRGRTQALYTLESGAGLGCFG